MTQFKPSILLLLNKKNDHQASVIDFLEKKEKINLKNLHFFNQEQESLKIETIRQLNSLLAYARSHKETSYFVLLHADLATLAAQNAMLKLLEEPPTQVQIILTANHLSKILGTIQSRCLIKQKKTNAISTDASENDQIGQVNYQNLCEKLKSYSALIDLAEQYKDRKTAQNFILDILEFLKSEKKTERNVLASKHLLAAYQQLEQNANVRLALENCFFTIKDSKKL
ncbi:MAG: hypothetical protein PVJ09_00910 [Candidatus Woesebacteria bacterium]|jgi:DNA polymerase III delta prime subunit